MTQVDPVEPAFKGVMVLFLIFFLVAGSFMLSLRLGKEDVAVVAQKVPILPHHPSTVSVDGASQVVYTEPSVTTMMGEFQKGEGCVQGFNRIGYQVTLKQCLLAAKEAQLPVLWYRPFIGKPATIIIPVKEGDPFGVILEKGQPPIVKLYKDPPKGSCNGPC